MKMIAHTAVCFKADCNRLGWNVNHISKVLLLEMYGIKENVKTSSHGENEWEHIFLSALLEHFSNLVKTPLLLFSCHFPDKQK